MQAQQIAEEHLERVLQEQASRASVSPDSTPVGSGGLTVGELLNAVEEKDEVIEQLQTQLNSSW